MRIAFWGNFGALNLGNECTLAAAVTNFRARISDAEMLVISRDPEDVAKRHGIGGSAISARTLPPNGRQYPKPLRLLRLAWFEAAEWLRAFRYAANIDALLVSGSGILSDEDEGILGLPYELLKWSLVVKLRGRKLCYVSVGAESISRPMSRRLIRWALGLADYRSYRDANSAALLATCGVKSQSDPVCPDLAFSLEQPNPPSLEQARSRDEHRTSRVAIGVFNYRGRGQGSSTDAAKYRGYLDGLCTLIAWLLAKRHPVRIVIGDFRYDDNVRMDLRTELERRGLLGPDTPFVDDPADSFERVLEQLATVDFVIASRYHNVLLGLFLGKPAISLSYEAKHEALMESMGLAGYCQSIGATDIPKLIEQFQRLEGFEATARDLMAVRVASNRAKLAEQYDLIAALIRR